MLDEKLHRASISGVNKPYRHSVTVPDSGRCEAFRIYLKVREMSMLFVSHR
jgi:hypothetical protein